MIRVELPDGPFLRGETLKGSVHFSTDSPASKKVSVVLLTIETNPHNPQDWFNDYSVHKLIDAKKLEIEPPETPVPFEYTIPENAPYTFNNGITWICWRIIAFMGSRNLMKLIQYSFAVITSDSFEASSRMGMHEFTVLPHVLKSGSPPLIGKAPMPVCKKHLPVKLKPLHSWRYSPFRRSSDLILRLNREQYTPGDQLSGTLYFSKESSDVDVTLFLVFLNKRAHGRTGEEEHVAAQTHGTFFRGSSFSFSYTIPLTVYPALETTQSKIWWVVRAVVSRPLKFTKTVEQEITINPLVY